MNRRRLLAHLKEYGCLLSREGRRHSVFYNPRAKKTSTVPRHSEVDDFLANKICKDLDIPPAKK